MMKFSKRESGWLRAGAEQAGDGGYYTIQVLPTSILNNPMTYLAIHRLKQTHVGWIST